MPKHRIPARTARSASSRPPQHDIRTTPLDELSGSAVSLLAASSLVLREVLWAGEPAPVATYIAARLHKKTAAVSRHAWTVASLVIRRTIGGELGDRPVREDDRAELVSAMAALAEACSSMNAEVTVGESGRARRDAAAVALEDAGTLMHEVGFEEFDASLLLATDRAGVQVVAWERVPRVSALIEQFEPLFAAANYLSSLDPLLELEIEGCTWWFSRWTAHGMAKSGSAFAARVRAQEWMYGDRSTLAGGRSVVAMLGAPPLDAMFPEKQKALAAALARSHASLFVVRERAKGRTKLEDIVDGRVFTVHEHSGTIDYRVGDIGAGRVIPVGDDVLRSPGMVLFTPPGPVGEFARTLAPAFSRMKTAMYDATIAVESVLALAVFGERVPRDPPPAASKRDAEARLLELNDKFSDAGLSHELRAEEAPPEMRAILAAGTGRKVIGYDIDQPLAEYAAALGAQARISGKRTAGR